MIDTIIAELRELKARVRELEAREVINPCCRVYTAATVKIPSGSTWVAIPFDQEVYDTHAMHSTTTNPSRITATVAGKYHIGCALEWEPVSGGSRWIAIRANGSAISSPVEHSPGDPEMVTCVDLQLTVGQYVEAVMRQDSGSDVLAQTVQGGLRFWAHKIG